MSPLTSLPWVQVLMKLQYTVWQKVKGTNHIMDNGAHTSESAIDRIFETDVTLVRSFKSQFKLLTKVTSVSKILSMADSLV